MKRPVAFRSAGLAERTNPRWRGCGRKPGEAPIFEEGSEGIQV